jgi:hypothetical protein
MRKMMFHPAGHCDRRRPNAVAHSRLRSRFRARIGAAIISLSSPIITNVARANLLDVNLSFSSLPSAQSWIYDSLNSPLTESQAFSADGSVLRMNTVGEGFQSQGANYYSRTVPTFVAGANWELDLTARVPQFETEYSDPAFNPFGFFVAAEFDNTGVSLALAGIVKLGAQSGSGNGQVIIPFDTTGWHNYRFVADRADDTYTFSIDNILESSGTLSAALGGYSAGISIGDTTGGENADADISSFHIFQTVATTVNCGQTFHLNASTGPGISVVPKAGVTINAGGTLIVDPAANHANRQLLVVTAPGLLIAGSTGNWTGLLDLTNNDMDLPGASLATVTDQIRQGYAYGKWNGSGGIISSSAVGDSTHLTALGVIQNNQNGSPLFTTFDTYAVSASDILVKDTYYGDASLDGKVDGSDYSLIDNGYLQHLTGWYNGDFNYDGVVNGPDYTLIDNAFNT